MKRKRKMSYLLVPYSKSVPTALTHITPTKNVLLQALAHITSKKQLYYNTLIFIKKTWNTPS